MDRVFVRVRHAIIRPRHAAPEDEREGLRRQVRDFSPCNFSGRRTRGVIVGQQRCAAVVSDGLVEIPPIPLRDTLQVQRGQLLERCSVSSALPREERA